MVKRKWLWGKKSTEKIGGETESSGSMSSHCDKISEDQKELIKSSPSNSQSQEVSFKDTESEINGEETNEEEQRLTQKLLGASGNEVLKDSLSKEITSMNGDTAVEDISKGSVSNEMVCTVSAEDTQGVKCPLQASNGCVEDNESFKILTEKLSAALVNVSLKDDLVKQHSKVAEEAVAGWEKAEKEADTLKQQLEAAVQKKSSLEARVGQLDEALKECVRQLRLVRDKQERKINQAVAEKTNELEVANSRLMDQLAELQALVETSRMNSPDLELRRRIDFLEEENVVLRQELQSVSEELDVTTIERDLSTKAAETASKQHLESIKKLARLEAECRKLKSLSRVSSLNSERKSSAAAASCVESLTDSQSDGAEQLSASECDSRKINSSWASALIAELDQFKGEKVVDKNTNSSSMDINLMDDFLEMERLAALPDSRSQVHSNGCDKTLEKAAHEVDGNLRIELESMARRTAELEENICRGEAEKAELAMTLAQTQSCFEESQVQLIETQMKLAQLERELHGANEGEQFYKALFIQFEREANLMSSQIKSLCADIDRERALSEQLSAKCKDLENELTKKEEELESQQDAMSRDELKMDFDRTQDRLENSEAQLKQAEMKIEELEKELREANEEKKSLYSELDCLRGEIQKLSSQIELMNEQAQNVLLNEQLDKELQKAHDEKKSLNSELDRVKAELLEANDENKSLTSELDSVRVELQVSSSRMVLMDNQAQNELLYEQLENELQKANDEKKSLNSVLDSVRAELLEANDDKKSLNSELDGVRVELQRLSSQIESLDEQAQKGLLNEQIEKELQAANDMKKSLNSELDTVRAELLEAKDESKSLNIELDGLRAELQTMSSQIELLNKQIQKEQALVAELSSKSEDLEYELQRKTQELDAQQRVSSNNEMKIKQEDLAIAAGKLADCQQTIASLGNQLKSLSTLEDFLIDTASIPGFPPPVPLMARRSSGEPWKLHSNETYLTEKEYEPFRNAQDDLSPFATHNRRDTRGSPASSSSSTSSAFYLNYPGPEKNENGFANFYSISRN